MGQHELVPETPKAARLVCNSRKKLTLLGSRKFSLYLAKNSQVSSNLFRERFRLFTVFSTLLLTTSPALRAQVLNMQAGVSISNLHSKIDGTNYTFLGQTRDDPSAFIGMEYLERKYWSISSNVGFVRKGGKEANWDSVGGPEITTTETFDYLSVNTLFNVKYPLGKWVPYVGIGPRVDFMLSHEHTFPYFENPGFLKDRSYGLEAAIGLRYAFSSFLVGIRAEHLYNFNHLVSLEWETNSTHTSILSATIGYRFHSHH
jgi:hypothetical protein